MKLFFFQNLIKFLCLYVYGSGPGSWNDPDMLLIGNFGLSVEQSKTQMAIWSILAAPLLMSTDLKHIRPELSKILLNRQIISVNQDVLGIQGRRIRYENNIEVEIRLYALSTKFQNKTKQNIPSIV